MRIEIFYDREDRNDSMSKIKERYLVICTNLRMECLASVADEVDTFIMRNWDTKRVSDHNNESILTFKLDTCSRIPNFSRFLYEIINHEAASAECY
jgi:hypothetical protein